MRTYYIILMILFLSGISKTVLVENRLQIDDSVSKSSEKIKEYGLLHKVYLSKGTLDGVLICKYFFPRMTPLQINEALRDIRRYIEAYVAQVVPRNTLKVGQKFLSDILNVYGHIIKFIENAWVDRVTGCVIVAKNQSWIPNADPLMDYWWHIENVQGIKLHCNKFYASCIDYLTIMIRSHLLFPCSDEEEADDMDRCWLLWLERVTCKLLENPIYGGYYQENVKLFREVYSLWKNDFEEKQRLRYKARDLEVCPI